SSTDHSAVFDRALSLPHFDDEATLVSARPVVPLREVAAKTRSRRHVIFGLTILAAILMGAISGSLLLKSGQNSQIRAETAVGLPTVSFSGAAGGRTVESAEARMAARDSSEDTQLRAVLGARDSLIRNRTTAANSRNSVKPAKVASPQLERHEAIENEEREIRRAERRNARREARRELRRRPDQMDDDLLRIREIFEGPSRP
ncbi:MAG: hypothetical protein ND866_20480, partial [Pyrinomonadaceae bacterium]|nr:hypothetical protein [Pyrinomonadaceae bacterium]